MAKEKGMAPIHIDHGSFKDEYHRQLLLRGVNLSGSSKMPLTPNGATYRREGFYNHRDVSFVGRPFPLDEADEHFARLRVWGLTLLRFLVTWEAVEHAGPGVYDEAYLDYLYAIVRKAGEYDIKLFIDPHQDVWSRFSGGDGAPGWTFEAVGLDITRFDATGAAITHQAHGDPFPRMIWPTNYDKLAAATMFTLFFAGNDFAPQLRVDGEPVQNYLQIHFIAAIKQVALRLKGLPNVIGYDTLNEPSRGYIGCPNLATPIGDLRMGDAPSPYQSMLLGAGFPQKVSVWKLGSMGFKRIGTRMLNPGRERVWLPGYECIWRQHGVWEVAVNGEPRLLRPDFFRQVNSRVVDFNRDYYCPFVNRYAAAIRSIDPQALIFIGTNPNHPLPEWEMEDAANIVFTPHWYDGLVLLTKDFKPWLGFDIHKKRLVLKPWAIRKSYARQINFLKQMAAKHLRGAPTLIGEVGVPFDLQDKRAYRTGDFSIVMKALDRSLRTMDDALAPYTIWNYTADNTNERGDLWNDEDLSIFSRDQQADPADIHSGGRGLSAVVRPYARATAGEPLRMSFDIRRRRFKFEFRHDAAITAPTEFFIPNYQYPKGYCVDVSDGRYEMDPETQSLRYFHTLQQNKHRVRVRPK
jgi:hypothetical protein